MFDCITDFCVPVFPVFSLNKHTVDTAKNLESIFMHLCARSLVVSIDGSVALPYNVIKYAVFAC